MKKLLNKKVIIFLFITILVVFAVSLLYKPKPPLPQLIASLPKPNAQRVSLVDPIKLKFDQVVDPSHLTVTSDPPEEWSAQVGDSNFTVVLKSKQFLRVETEYSLSISYNSQPVSTLTFKTTTQQGDPRYTQEVLQTMARDYPLAVKLPYSTPLYRVVYSSPLTLEISIKNLNISSQEAIDEVKEWVTKNGGDAGAHKYIIAAPNTPVVSPTN